MVAIDIIRPQKGVIIVHAYIKGYHVGEARFEDFIGEGEYRIRMIAVADKHQRKGIGTLLIQTGMQQTKVMRMTLSTHKSVLPFYLSLGFRITKEKSLDGFDLLWEKTY